MNELSNFALQVYKDVMSMHPKNCFIGCDYVKIDNEGNATLSTYPYGCDDAKIIVLFCKYEYQAGQRGFNEKTFYAIFIDENRTVNDFLKIGKWKIKFADPIQEYYHTNDHKLIITNDSLGIKTILTFSYNDYANEFCLFWSYLKVIVQQTNPDIISFIIQQFINKVKLDKEILENLYMKAEQSRNAETIAQYKLLLDKLENLVQKLPEQ